MRPAHNWTSNAKIEPATVYGGRNFSSARLSSWPVLSVAAWLAIGAAGLARFLTRFVRLHRSLRSGPPVSAPHLRQIVEALRQAAGAHAPIRLTTSATCAVPLALAGRQVVLPERFLDQLDAEQQHAALAHEIAHVVRRDPAWRVVAGVLERAFFFQPLNRIARVRLAESAEFLCDQWAVQHTRRPLALARCLSAVAAWTSQESDGVLAGASPMAHSDSPLVRRVTRILADGPRRSRPVGDVAGRSLDCGRDRCAAGDRRAAGRSGGVGGNRREPCRGHRRSPPARSEQKEKASPARTWTATEMAQARAQLRVLRPPTPADPLNLRWQWALAEAARQGIGGFWVVYSFQTPTHANHLMMSDTREGSFVTVSGHMTSSGPPLTDLLDDPASAGA